MAAGPGVSGPDIVGADQVNMRFIALIVAVATIGGFMFGYDSGVINGTQDGLESAFGLSKLGTGFNVGAILLGCAFGAFGAGRLSDMFGRKGVMLVAAGLFIISAIWAGAADSSAHFIIARFIGGLGVGAASVLAPAYISEVTPASIRGRLSSVQQIMIITGLTGAFLANDVLAATAGGSTAEFWLGLPAWRWMFWLRTIPAAIYLCALLLIPESPRYLVVKGRDAQATAVLTRLFGAEAAARKVVEIRDSLAADHRPKLADLLDPGARKVRPIVWAGLILAVFQQLVGINIVFYYGAVLWQSVGFSENDALLINILSGTLSIVACLFAMALIDKIGRLLSRDEGKTLSEGIGETVRAGRILKYFAGEALRLHGQNLASTRLGVEIQTYRQPVGVFGLITPWNFPIAIPAWKLTPAIAFGNCVVIKAAACTATATTTGPGRPGWPPTRSDSPCRPRTGR